jgi:acyl carrier protein
MSIDTTQTSPTERQLQAIVAKRLEVDPTLVDLDKAMLGDLGLDSFDLVGIVLEVEQAFKPVSVSDKSADDIRTLRELAAYIDSELGR